MQLRSIQLLDRYELQYEFFMREPYVLLSIRRPGSHLPEVFNRTLCAARCDIMLHEWDVESPPYPLPPTKLTPRQAVKIAEFISEHIDDAKHLIFQSETPSGQQVAIAETLGQWLDVPIQRCFPWPKVEPSTAVTMQMAIDSLEILNDPKQGSHRISHTDHDTLLSVIELIVQMSNVAVVLTHRVDECQCMSGHNDLEFGMALGISMDRDVSHFEPCDGFVGQRNLLSEILTICEVAFCPHAGCEKCLPSFTTAKIPICLSIIFDARQLPPTFDRVLEAGGSWVILTNATMRNRITRICRGTANHKASQHPNHKLQMLTLDRDHNPMTDVLHDILRGKVPSWSAIGTQTT
ncbi:hypothetical protein Q31b_37540 [Novipirellula aureliae]|uniref:Uncharacterized protein n=1 Tax=Novipirellula aureliae TaxID=2527966 RepID=A0A5C6DUF4_9BACT|nr:hypothetical protein Q31b_37540 [Novipirellula aureliae]